jgi:hypothetical protein
MDFDSPWKEALELYFQAFLALFYPHIHADIDWSRGYVFLDKELQKIVPKAGRGRLYVDKLVKVWRKNGREAWVLIHIEVQAQREAGFPRRMYRYNTRLTERYNRTVVSLAVLADDDPNWRPDHYQKELWDWSVRMGWPALKLLDYANRVAELESSKNPFAKVVLAHLKALETRQDPADRRAWKVRLVKGLFKRGLSAEDARQLFRFIDWVMALPPALEALFRDEIDQYEKEKRVPYITSIERLAMEETYLKGIAVALEIKFGAAGQELMPEIRELQDHVVLEAVLEAIPKVSSPEQLRRVWARKRRPKKGRPKE